MTNTRNTYIPHLDVLRWIAAMMIILLHAYEAYCGWWGQVGLLSNGTKTALSSWGKVIDQFIRNFGHGVDIFFLISGFLITFLLLEEKKTIGNISIWKFMLRRSFRIWPLYFLIIAIGPIIVSWLQEPSPNYTCNLLFLGNFEIIQSQKWLYPFGHFWSICIEEHFYLVWPFIIAFMPTKRLMTVFLSLILLSICFRMIAWSNFHEGWYYLFTHTLSRIDVLVIGSIGGYYHSISPLKIYLSRIQRVLIFGTLILVMCIEPIVQWDTLIMAAFKKYIYVGLSAVLMLDFLFNPAFKHILKPNSFIHYLGKTSYGIYMFGNVILLIVVKQIMHRFGITNLWIFIGIVFTLSILIPIVSYEFFEKPFLKLSARFRPIRNKA
jgi:peptidoglycan/LPS O-acetylase OafA/YrhL